MNAQEQIEIWLSYLDTQGKSPLTIAAYRRALAHFVRWSETSYGQTFDSSQIIVRDVRDWKSFQQTVEKAAPATINQRLTAVTRFFEWAEAQGFLRQNPAKDVGGVQSGGRQPKALTAVQLRRLLRAVHAGGSLRDIALVEFLAGTGLRVSELLALHVEDIAIQPRSGSVIVREGKHGRQRIVPLTAAVRNELSAYLQTHPSRNDPKSLLWWGERGSLRDRKAVERILNRYAHIAELEPFGPHALRHTFATQYLTANPDDLRGLASLLGHVSLDTIMVYTEPSLDDLAERLDKCGRL